MSKNSINRLLLIVGSVVSVATLFGVGCACSDFVFGAVDSVTLSIPSSCMISASGSTTHEVILAPGVMRNAESSPDPISKSRITATCNDANGYSIYAIGFGNDIEGTTDMIAGDPLTSESNIATGNATNGNISNWAMKVIASTGTDAPTINTTDENGTFADYRAVPTTYTKVASKASGVVTTNTSYIDTAYQVYVATNQPAGSYSGKVKYILINPSMNQTDLPEGYIINESGELEKVIFGGITTMQQMTPEICAAEPTPDAVDTEVPTKQLRDTRDNKLYWVAKLADGNCWMTQNLAFDLIAGETLTSTTTDLNEKATWTIPTTTETASTITDWTCSNDTACAAAKSYSYGDTTYGNYYSWYAATANSGKYSTATNIFPSDSICPKGWRLAVIDEYNGLGITSATMATAAPFNFVLGGYVEKDYEMGGSSDYGTYITAFANSNAARQQIWKINASGAPSMNGYEKDDGATMRCIAHRASIQPTITYDANGGTGVPSPTQATGAASEFVQSITLSSTTPTKSGNVFVGWNTKSDGTGAWYQPGSTITTASNITLYANWLNEVTSFDSAFASAGKTKQNGYYKMQDMTSSICNSVSTMLGSYTVSTQLIDTRDNKIYWVAKLADGNCWMTQNLDLDLSSSTTLTPDNTNIISNWTPASTATTVKTTNLSSSNWATTSDYTHPYSFDGGNAYLPNGLLSSSCSNKDITTCSGVGTLDLTNSAAVKDNVNAHYHVGNLYTWTAAIAMNNSSSYSSDTAGNYNNSPQTSICPKGWKLPNGAYNGDLKKLIVTTYGIASSAAGEEVLRSSPLYFARSGYANVGSLYNVGSFGVYWSSTVLSSDSVYYLTFSITYGNVSPTDNFYRNRGYAVRCIAQ